MQCEAAAQQVWQREAVMLGWSGAMVCCVCCVDGVLQSSEVYC